MFDTRFVAFNCSPSYRWNRRDMARLRVCKIRSWLLVVVTVKGFCWDQTWNAWWRKCVVLWWSYNNHLSVAQEKHVEWNIKDVTNWEGLTCQRRRLGIIATWYRYVPGVLLNGARRQHLLHRDIHYAHLSQLILVVTTQLPFTVKISF